MRVLQVPERSTYSNYSCGICGRKLRAGDWVLHVSSGEGLIARIAPHVRCVRALTADVPDVDRDTFEALRQRILTTGDAFPD